MNISDIGLPGQGHQTEVANPRTADAPCSGARWPQSLACTQLGSASWIVRLHTATESIAW